MTTRADSNFKFLWRFLAIGIVFLGFSIYSLYDGIVVYPKKLEAAKAYYALDENMDATEKTQLWRKMSKENGWSREKPKAVSTAKFDLYFQYAAALGTFAIGFPCLIKFFRTHKSWVETDGKSIKTSRGVEFSFKQITAINKSKWEDKGIARVKYDSKDGERTFVLDDFKYKREPMAEIMKLIEQNVDADLIKSKPTKVTESANDEKSEEASKA